MANEQRSQDELEIPVSLFKSIHDYGARRPFWLKGANEAERETNAWVVDYDDISTDCPDNADFLDNRVTTWEGLVKVMTNFSKIPFADKKAAPLFASTQFKTVIRWDNNRGRPYKGFRNQQNAQTSAMVVIDGDRGLHYKAVVEYFRDNELEAIIHTTASNTTGERFHIIIPLLSPVSFTEHKQVVLAVCRFLDPDWVPDTTKLTCDSMFYVPGCYDGADNHFVHIKGGVLGAEHWLEIAPAPAEPEKDEAHRITTRTGLSGGLLSKEAAWSVDDCRAVQEYRGLSSGRHAKLFGLLTAIAKSAYNKGYLLDDYELADLVWQEHEGNRPSSPYTFRQIASKAARAIGEAEAIADPYFEKSANWRTWGQPEPWKSGTEGIMSFKEMLADYAANPPQQPRVAEDDEPQSEPYDDDGERDEPPPQDDNTATLPLIWDAGEEDDDHIPPRQWLLGNVICRRFLTLLFGPGGVGKTSFVIAWAMSLASAMASIIDEHVFQRCKVLYVSMEDDADEVKRRIKAACKYHQVAKADLKGWLYVYNISKGKKLATINAKGQVQDGKLAAELSEIVKGLKIDVVILDPFKKAHGCPENDNTAIDFVADVLTNLAIEQNIAVVALHHVAKGRNEAGDADIGRGASALKDAARLGFTLTGMEQTEAAQCGIKESERWSYVRFDSAKVNIAPRAENAKWLKLVSVDLENKTSIYPHGDSVQTVETTELADIKSFKNDKILLKTVFARIIHEPCKYSMHGKVKEENQLYLKGFPPNLVTAAQARCLVNDWKKAGYLEDGVLQYTATSSGNQRTRKGLKIGPAAKSVFDEDFFQSGFLECLTCDWLAKHYPANSSWLEQNGYLTPTT